MLIQELFVILSCPKDLTFDQLIIILVEVSLIIILLIWFLLFREFIKLIFIGPLQLT